jgi:hypothetical protein
MQQHLTLGHQFNAIGGADARRHMTKRGEARGGGEWGRATRDNERDEWSMHLATFARSSYRNYAQLKDQLTSPVDPASHAHFRRLCACLFTQTQRKQF